MGSPGRECITLAPFAYHHQPYTCTLPRHHLLPLVLPYSPWSLAVVSGPHGGLSTIAPRSLSIAGPLRWNWELGKTPAPHPSMIAHYPPRLPTSETTHNVLSEADFEASNEVEESHEEPDRDFKTNMPQFLSNHFPCKSDQLACHWCKWPTAYHL